MLNDLIDDRVTTPVSIRKQVFYFCVFLRCLLGFLAINELIPRWILIALYSILLIFFIVRANGQDTWKPYTKSVYLYTMIIGLLITKKESAGVLMILDAITGLTSRDMFEKLLNHI